MTTPMATQMALGVASIVLLVALILIFIGPTITPYGRKQWALIMVTLIVLWLPMSWYLFFIVGRSTHVDTQQAVLAAALNLVIGVPVFRFIVMNGILKRK
jgi:hypothetical protein